MEETSGCVFGKDFKKLQQNSTILLYNNFVVHSFVPCVRHEHHFQSKPIQKHTTQGKITIKRDASVLDNSIFLYVVVMAATDDDHYDWKL